MDNRITSVVILGGGTVGWMAVSYLDQVPLSHYWYLRRAQGQTDEPYDYACLKEPAWMDAKRAPRYRDGQRATRYAWHFDAQRVADFLCRFATEQLGVRHVQDQMTEA